MEVTLLAMIRNRVIREHRGVTAWPALRTDLTPRDFSGSEDE